MWVPLSLLLRLWVAVYLWVMSEYVYFAVSWVWCGIKWSRTPNCWMVLSGKISLLFLLLCYKRTDTISVTGFLLTYVLSCWLRRFLQSLWPEIFFSVGVCASYWIFNRCVMCRFITVLFPVLQSLCGLWTAISSVFLAVVWVCVMKSPEIHPFYGL